MAENPLKGYVKPANWQRTKEVGAKNVLANLERMSTAGPGEKNSEYEECLRRMLAIYLS